MGQTWPTYSILSSRSLTPDQMHIDHLKSPVTLKPELAAAVADYCAQKRQLGQRVDDSPLYRVTGYSLTDTLVLRCEDWTYEQYLGLSGLNDEINAGQSLVVSMATRLRDGWVLESRSQQVAEGRGLLHVKPSGHIHPPEDGWSACLREAEEELALKPEELTGATLTGLVQSKVTRCLALTFCSQSELSLSDIEQRVQADAWEAESLLCVEDTPDGLALWLAEHRLDMAGIGHATLLLAGRRFYGDDWYERQLKALQVDIDASPALEAVVMYRPVGPSELVLLEQSDFRAWPPRRPDQPIFYPVTSAQYAREITTQWNVPSYGSGYVTRFSVRRSFAEQFAIECVGAERHTEWWIPAERVDEMNDNLVGPIEVIESYP